MPLHDNSVAAALAAEAAAAGGAAFAAAPVASAQSSDFGQIGQMVEQMGAQHGIDAEQVRQYASQVPGLDQLGFGSLELPASLGDAHKPTNGTDFGAPIGTPLYAAKSGVVVASGPAAGYGIWIQVRTDDGELLEYGHNDQNYVTVGQRVSAGQVIGTVGN